MKFYKVNNEVMAIEQGQEFLVQADWVLMTDAEVELFKNPPKTQEQLLNEWKASRQLAVDNIEVLHNGVIYQGDEISQTRISRAMSVMTDTDVFDGWIAKDNTPHSLTKADFAAILKDAGIQQSLIWSAGRPV